MYVPMEPVINIIKNQLEQNAELSNRTSMSIWHIITLLWFYLKNTYFLYQGKYYKHVQGTTMGSPIKPLVASLFKDFEVSAISTSSIPLTLWRRYVGDTFVIKKIELRDKFMEHINFIDCYIQFTTGETGLDGSKPFLDTLVTPEPDRTLSTTMYRKLPTQISIYIVTATIIFLPSIACLILSHGEKELFKCTTTIK